MLDTRSFRIVKKKFIRLIDIYRDFKCDKSNWNDKPSICCLHNFLKNAISESFIVILVETIKNPAFYKHNHPNLNVLNSIIFQSIPNMRSSNFQI